MNSSSDTPNSHIVNLNNITNNNDNISIVDFYYPENYVTEFSSNTDELYPEVEVDLQLLMKIGHCNNNFDEVLYENEIKEESKQNNILSIESAVGAGSLSLSHNDRVDK